MDFQSQIELKVKVLDKDLDDLEKRIQKLNKVNPFSASGASKGNKSALRQQQAILNVDKNRAQLQIQLKQGQIKQLNTTNSWVKALAQGLEIRKDIAEAAQKEAAATKKTASKAAGKRFQSAALGVGFPLLFGGGAGSVLGGLAGSAGGFGGQILGSAIGQQIDNFVQEIGKLGQALNVLTPDVDALVKAAGLAGTATEDLIKSIEKAEGAQVAQAAAAEQMAAVIGLDGVNALQSAGSAVTDLGNEASKAFTALAAALAPALESVASFLANNLQEQRQLSRVDPGFLGSGGGDLADNKDVLYVRGLLEKGIIREEAARTRILNIVREIEAAEAKTATANLQNLRTVDATLSAQTRNLAISETEKQIAELGGDIKNDAVYALQKQSIELDYQVKIQDILNDEVKTELDRRIRIVKLQALANNRAADLADLENKRNKALASGSGSAPESKALQLQQQLVREELKRAEIAVKRVSLIVDEETAIEGQQLLLQRRLNDETKIIELQREQALAQNKVAGDIELINRLKDSQLETLKEQLELEKATNNERLRAIRLEKELQSIKNTQELAGISTDLTRQIEDTQFRTNNPFGGDAVEQRELEIEQGRRYADLLTDIADKEELVNAAVRSRLKDGKEATAQQVEELNQLERKKQLYAELIPQLNAAEQAELRMAQTLEMLSPVTNALASGLTDMITGLVDGTKSAEEALSDMFKNIGAAFIQMATEMIAQALVMKALGILMPGAGGGGGGLDLAGVASYMPGGSSYEGGGYTGNAPRSGGVDGRGGFPAILHPNETVIDHESAMGKYSPGGGGAGGGSRTIRFESTTINEVSFVTTEQAMAMSRQAADDGAKRGAAGGHAKTMNTLQNNRSSRARIGMR